MSYGTRKAIGGMRSGVERAILNANECIARFDAANTVADVRVVLAWMKQRSWFLCPSPLGDQMREAFERARQRANVLPAAQAEQE